MKITYWITTLLLSAMMLFSSFAYFTSADVKAGFVHLGYPSYFRVELAIAKVIGAALLIFATGRVKEWAYAGFAITIISALIAHISVGDPAGKWIPVIMTFALLATSYVSYYRRIATFAGNEKAVAKS